MGLALSRRINRQQRAIPVAVSSPVGGWNTRDSLDAMTEDDAVTLDNWWPGFGSCSIRPGSVDYASGLGASVKFLAEFNAGTNRKFIAGANLKIWDISSAGAGVSLATGFLSDNWLAAQFDDSGGGARMGLVNGADSPQIYNGTAVSAMTVSGSGLTTSTLNGIHIYKNRSFFWSDTTQDFWYSATNALGGTLTKFPLGRVQGTGGNLLAMGTWSRDAGNGIQDLAVFVLTSGDVLVYAGDNPGDAAAWSLVSRYTIGAPVSKRAVKKIGSDLIMVTKAGYVALNAVLEQGRVNEQAVAVSSKIRGAAITATASYAANFGWDLCLYPSRNMLIVNVPISTSIFNQHVMNTETKAWTRFVGIQSICWGSFNDKMYFGKSDGTVKLYDSGYNDSGSQIVADGQLAWSYLKDRRRTKRATGINIRLRTTSDVSFRVGTGFDFQGIDLGSTITNVSLGATSAPWDTSAWDVTPWSSENFTSSTWAGARGSGYAISSRLQVATSAIACEWLSTTYLVEAGGIL